MPRHDRQARREDFREWAGEVMGRDDLRDRFQDFAQIWFDRNGMGVDGPALQVRQAPPPPRTDYTPFYIAGAATLLAALIVTRKK